MRILFITERFPWPLEDGGNLRSFHVLKALAREHEVTLLSHAPQRNAADAIEAVGRLCDIKTVDASHWLINLAESLLKPSRWQQPLFVLKNWSNRLYRMARRLLETNSYDAVHFNHLDTAAFVTIGHWPSSVFDSHNVISSMAHQLSTEKSGSFLSAIYRRESNALSQLEREVCKSCDAVLACSQLDRDAFSQLAPAANVYEIPNGVDCKVFARRPTKRQSTGVARIVFTGAMDYRPNVKGVEWFCEQVLPLVQARHPHVLFQIVGRDPVEQVQKLGDAHRTGDTCRAVEVTGRVESVVPYLHEASLVVVPLLHGGGTRLKILEAFAAGCAVVSTTKGAEGINAVDGQQILLADTAEALADSIARLLNNADEAYEIGIAGRTLVEEKYNWSSIGAQVLHVYRGIQDDSVRSYVTQNSEGKPVACFSTS